MKSQFPTLAECIFLAKRPFYYLPLRKWWLKRSAQHMQLPQQFPPSLESGQALTGEALLDGYFEFDGETHEFEKADWRFKRATENWRLSLHSFSWLHDLKAVGSDEARSAAAAIVLDWCDKHQSWRKQSWSSVATAERICAWLGLFDFISSKMSPEQKRVFVTSLWMQILHLNKAFPLDAIGADRLTVAKALILSDLAFYGETSHKFMGWKLIERELRRQILPDGGIKERSAGRNLQALVDLIEVRAALRAFGKVVPPTLHLAIQLLGTVVEALKLPDGELAHHHAGNKSGLLAKALSLSGDIEAKYSFPESGFERMEAKRSVLLINTGQVDKPSYNRYLHAAPLALEFSLGKQRLIVNCGSHPNQQRFGEAERTTAAHSTLIVDDLNALPIQKIRASKSLNLEAPQNAGIKVSREAHELLVVSHGFYERVGGGILTRQVQMEEDGEMLLGLDQVANSQKTNLSIRFHLHPDILVRVADNMVFLRMPTGRPWRFDVKEAEVSVTDSVYFEDGAVRPTKQIHVHKQILAGSAVVEWTLAREGRAARQYL